MHLPIIPTVSAAVLLPGCLAMPLVATSAENTPPPVVNADPATVAEFVEATTHNLTARHNSVAGVYMCKQPNWKGECVWDIASGGKCHNYNWGPKSSWGPDQGLTCTLYRGLNCEDTRPVTGIQYPGFTQFEGNLMLLSKGFWFPGSYKCHWT